MPSSKVPLHVELLAGKMLYRAPIAEDLLYSTAPSLQWHAHSFVVLVILFYCEFAAPYLEHIKEQICTQFKLSVLLTPALFGFQNERKSSKGNALFFVWSLSQLL